MKRIYSTEEKKFKKRLGELRYHHKKIRDSIENFKRGFRNPDLVSRESFQEYNQKKENKRVPFVLAHHPAFGNVAKIISEHWPMIQEHQNLHKIFQKPPVAVFRKPKSLKDLLVRADISTSKPGIGQCKGMDSA